ncbi:hypothetical protein QX776_16230 [Alteromonadaceae bacterium BrNp21-10]|nr:hypothetical protein [Alteromonadaceae bacterium BrNp21-10]
MANLEEDNKFKQKWWLHSMDPENLAELSDSDRRNAKSFNGWLFIWGIVFFGVVIFMEPLSGGIETTPVWRFLLASSPLALGIFLVHAFIRMIRGFHDELLIKIYYEALATGFLFAFFIGMCFSLSAPIIGASLKAGPFMLCGLIAGYYAGLTLKYRKYNA